MRVPSIVSSLIGFSTFGMTIPATWAGEYPDGTVFFEAPPRLEKVTTTFNETQMWGATYYFTLTLPAQAGEPLGKLIIKQRGGIEDIALRLDQTVAFVGTPDNQQDSLSLSNISQSDDNREINVELESLVEPGTTITLGLKPRRNPKFDGVYLFGVTAIPAGDTAKGLYLGVGRLQFYDRDDSDFRKFP